MRGATLTLLRAGRAGAAGEGRARAALPRPGAARAARCASASPACSRSARCCRPCACAARCGRWRCSTATPRRSCGSSSRTPRRCSSAAGASRSPRASPSSPCSATTPSSSARCACCATGSASRPPSARCSTRRCSRPAGCPEGISTKPKVELARGTRTDAGRRPRAGAGCWRSPRRTCPGTIDDLDTEFLHDLRVSIRRARSVLRELKDVHDPAAAHAPARRAQVGAEPHRPGARPRRRSCSSGRSSSGCSRPSARRSSSRCASCSRSRRARELTKLRRGLRERTIPQRCSPRGTRSPKRRPRTTSRTPRGRSRRSPPSGSARSTAGWCATAAGSTTARRPRTSTTCASAARSCATCSSCSAARSRSAWSSRWSRRSRTCRRCSGASRTARCRSSCCTRCATSCASEPATLMALGSLLDALVADQQAARDEFADDVRPLQGPRGPEAVKVVATYSIKGGVGKTSAAVNVAALAARDGLRTRAVGPRPAGRRDVPVPRRAEGEGRRQQLIRGKREPLAVMKGTDVEGLDLLPADFSYRHLDIQLDKHKKPLQGLARVLAQLEDGYDLAILDCAPSISLVSESVFSRRRPAARAARALDAVGAHARSAARLPGRGPGAGARGAPVLLDGRPPQEPAQGARRRRSPASPRRRSRTPARSS